MDIQNELNKLDNNGGGKLYLPAGTYKITKPLVYNGGAPLTIEGDGFASCISSSAGVALDFTGHVESHLTLRNLRFQSDGTPGSIGIRMRGGAFNSFENVYIYKFDTGFDFADVDQTSYSNLIVRWCRTGGVIRPAINVTSANSHHFFGCTIGNNSVRGLEIHNPNSVSFFGGTVQYNGMVGAGAGVYGIYVDEAGDGYGTVNFNGVAFEGNGGVADIICNQVFNPCVVNFSGCSFTRTTNYATANIWIYGSAQNCFYNLRGNTFRGLAGYVPNASRPNILVTNGHAKISDDGTNFYEWGVEAPKWPHKA